MMAILAVLFYVILLEFIRSNYLHFKNKPQTFPDQNLPAVSIVIAFRNEKEWLPDLVNQLLKQKYSGPEPEIILVDDHSTDSTVRLLSGFSSIKILQLDEHEKGKKSALSKGVQEAANSWIVTTDADVNVLPNWLEGMMQSSEAGNPVMICGRVEVKSDGSFLQDFQKMETGILQSFGAATMETGFPLLNTGASLAFRKEAWQSVGGYKRHEHIASGDDVFLLFDLHKEYPGRVVYSNHYAARVETYPSLNAIGLWKQRIRWSGKMRHSSSFPVILTGIVVIAAALSIVYLLLTGKWTLLLFLLALRGVVEIRLLKASETRVALLHQVGMILTYPIYLVILSITAIFWKPGWKGR